MDCKKVDCSDVNTLCLKPFTELHELFPIHFLPAGHTYPKSVPLRVALAPSLPLPIVQRNFCPFDQQPPVKTQRVLLDLDISALHFGY